MRSHAAVDPGVEQRSNEATFRGRLRPDDMVLRRSAFDFLKKKGVVQHDAWFTLIQSRGELQSITLEEFGRPGEIGTEISLKSFAGSMVGSGSVRRQVHCTCVSLGWIWWMDTL